MALAVDTRTIAIPDAIVGQRGAYVTDGTRLLRVVSPLSAGRRAAVLEDCLTLEVRDYPPEELWQMRLRAVRERGGGAVPPRSRAEERR